MRCRTSGTGSASQQAGRGPRVTTAIHVHSMAWQTGDLLVAVVDGLKGFPEAITTVFPECIVQTCIVHLIRYSLQSPPGRNANRLPRR